MIYNGKIINLNVVDNLTKFKTIIKNIIEINTKNITDKLVSHDFNIRNFMQWI
jgi:hypothetical protein